MGPEGHGQGKAEEENLGSGNKEGNDYQLGKTGSALPPKKPRPCLGSEESCLLIRSLGQYKSVMWKGKGWLSLFYLLYQI